MKNLINSVKRAFINFRIKMLDRRYINLSRELDSLDKALQMNQRYTYQNRTNTMFRRRSLRDELLKLEGNLHESVSTTKPTATAPSSAKP